MVFLKERYVYLFIIAFCIVLLFIIPSQLQEGAPRIAPYISVAIILLCSAICLVRCIKGDEKVLSFQKDVLRMLVVSIVLYGIYVYTIDWFGYFILSFIFLAVMLWMLNVRSLFKISLISILVPLSIYFVLVKLLNLQFPTGYFLSF